MAGRYDINSGEENAMWTASVTSLKEIKELHVAGEIASKQVNRWKKALNSADGDHKVIEVVDKLIKYGAEYIDILMRENTLLHGASENMSLLIALRQATEAGLGGNEESRRKKRKMTDVDNISDGRARKRGVPDALMVGSSVAFKQPKTKGLDGDWIQCNIVRVMGEGPKARCEIQDPEPDENGLPGQKYKTVLTTLIPIQKDNIGLPPHPKGAHVLARYPETTTFYKAEVMASRKETCMLRFEGEEEIEKLTEVERRLVLDLP